MTYDPGPAPASSNNDKTLVVILYALSLAGFVTGITALVALVIALVKKADVRGTIYESHFDLIIWTNIWAIVGFIAVTVVGILLLIVLIGAVILWLGYLAVAVWYGARLIIGLIKLTNNQPIQNPRGYLF